MESLDTLAMGSTGLGYLLGLVVDLALLAVALTTVRKHRPDASGALVVASLLFLVTGCATPATTWLLTMVGGVDTIRVGYPLASLIAGVVWAAGFALVIA